LTGKANGALHARVFIAQIMCLFACRVRIPWYTGRRSPRRGIQAKILAFDFMTVTVRESETSFILRDEIQAIRVLANNDPTIARFTGEVSQ